MPRSLRSLLAAACLLAVSAPAARAGDYDQALFVLSRAFPQAKNIGVFYDSQGTLLNLLEFEGSAFKQFGVNIKLVPTDKSLNITSQYIRTICARNRIQAVLLLEDDTLFTPESLAARGLIQGAGHLPIASANEAWLTEGAWFAVGPKTQGLKLGPKVKDEKLRTTLLQAGKEMPALAN